MRERFEDYFSKLLADIRNGTLHPLRIDLREKPITKKHLHSLVAALEENFHIASKIIEIDLSFTKIDYLPPNIFRDCDALKRLNVENNKLKHLPNLPDRPYALQDFVASHNPLKNIADRYFKNCISLKTVYLNDTQLEKVPSLEDSLSLAWLHLNTNPIKKFPEKYFAYLDHLDTIFINETDLKELPNLSYCTRLQEVWIDDIKIPTSHIAATAQIFKYHAEE